MGAEVFGARLKAVREEAGLSQKALAEKAGLVTSAIGHLEQGLRKPTWETVLALTKALGVPCTAFVGPEDGSAVEEPATAPRRAGRPRKVEAEAEEPAATPKGRRRKT
jgi:XRE family transcriptional regulator, regulator of sulfur utilization